MKIILSRKGFDAGTGKRASFITQKGELVSLPIPDKPEAQHGITYQKITSSMGCLGAVLPAIKARTKGKPSQYLTGNEKAHLDPDLSVNSIPRNGNWVGAFGQRTSGAVNLLIKHSVGPGDLFLFFGWFKRQDQTSPLRHDPDAPDLHVVFGYLQVDAVYENHQHSTLLLQYRGLTDHPHLCAPRNGKPKNRIFVAKQNLALPGVSNQLPGGGLFDFDPKRVLTRAGMSRCYWLLRGIGIGSSQQPPLHRGSGRFNNWKKDGNDWQVEDFGRGQEFVIDTNDFPGALEWAKRFF